MASHWTNGGLKRILDGTRNLSTATVKVMLLGTAYVPNKDHEFVSDIVANEISGTGYVGGFGGSGRKALANKTFTKDDALDEARFDADNPTWPGADFGTVGYAALVIEDTNDASSPVLAILDCEDKLTSGGTLTLDFGAFALKLRA
jgi:hypothetical protein